MTVKIERSKKKKSVIIFYLASWSKQGSSLNQRDNSCAAKIRQEDRHGPMHMEYNSFLALGLTSSLSRSRFTTERHSESHAQRSTVRPKLSGRFGSIISAQEELNIFEAFKTSSLAESGTTCLLTSMPPPSKRRFTISFSDFDAAASINAERPPSITKSGSVSGVRTIQKQHYNIISVLNILMHEAYAHSVGSKSSLARRDSTADTSPS
jgi:hypothetical protein